MLHAVIMAGGSGTRFWPLSRTETPKQLLNLVGDQTMIQQTYDRCQGLPDLKATWVVTNVRQQQQTRDQLATCAPERILAEPLARNTAPCIGLAAIHVLAQDPQAEMLVMPADHVIENVERFQAAVQSARQLIQKQPEFLALFGVVPHFPSTGFGYIERGACLSRQESPIFKVAAFREKPDHETAEDYLRRGTFFWNCGIFVWKAATILQAIAEHEPNIYACLQKIQAAIGTPEYEQVLVKEFANCPSISIDYGVLERAKQIAVVEALFDWDDLGSWQALHRLLGVDENGNTVVGLHVGVDTNDCVIRSSDEHVITTIGIKNCIIVHTPDATLVADKQDENAIKELIAVMKETAHARLL